MGPRRGKASSGEGTQRGTIIHPTTTRTTGLATRHGLLDHQNHARTVVLRRIKATATALTSPVLTNHHHHATTVVRSITGPNTVENLVERALSE